MGALSEAPPLALIAFGITVAVIFGVRFLGLFSGTTAGPEKSRAAAQVATVIVDPAALNKATAALESHTLAINRLIMIGDDIRKAMAETAEELGRIREELRIHREVRRDR